MLTRKQAWRRVRSRQLKKFDEHDWETILQGEIFKWDSSLKKLNKIHTWTGAAGTAGAVSTDIRSQSCTFGDRSRKVSFDPTVRVVLIPSVSDFSVADRNLLWWSAEERMNFKRSGFQEWQKHGQCKDYFFKELKSLLEEKEAEDILRPHIENSVDPLSPNPTEQIIITIKKTEKTEDIAGTPTPKFSFIDETFFTTSPKKLPERHRNGSLNHLPIPVASMSPESNNHLAYSWPGHTEFEKHWVSDFSQQSKGEGAASPPRPADPPPARRADARPPNRHDLKFKNKSLISFTKENIIIQQTKASDSPIPSSEGEQAIVLGLIAPQPPC